ncbi:MAG: Gfo/Idh/MocA family oxidoreductase [Lachnospiraceae bacterium]|nr:Gfo/Idh/MocA family oxidoreductase [Lachnospiraceae bacterium]
MNGRIRTGIIGLGNMGAQHAMSIFSGKCPDLRLSAVCDGRDERLRWAEEQFGPEVRRYQSVSELLDSGEIDACVVAVPHYGHCELVKECLGKGIHVMCEKPAGVYTKEVREMNAEADRHPELVFGMMFNQRTNPVYRKMKAIVDSGLYGQIRRTNWIVTDWYRSAAYYNSGGWRATWAGEGGGVLLNQCPHQLDLFTWIAGMPVLVDAHLSYGKWHDIEVEDDVTAYLEYENGATGAFITSTGDPHGTNRFEIQMDRAQLIVEHDKLTLYELSESEPEFSRRNTIPFAHPEAREIPVDTDGPNPQHVGVLNAFAAKILGKGELVADGREGINGLTLSNAMHLSSWTGGPVRIPFDEDLFLEELNKRRLSSRKKALVHETVADLKDSYNGSLKA